MLTCDKQEAMMIGPAKALMRWSVCLGITASLGAQVGGGALGGRHIEVAQARAKAIRDHKRVVLLEVAFGQDATPYSVWVIEAFLDGVREAVFRYPLDDTALKERSSEQWKSLLESGPAWREVQAVLGSVRPHVSVYDGQRHLVLTPRGHEGDYSGTLAASLDSFERRGLFRPYLFFMERPIESCFSGWSCQGRAGESNGGDRWVWTSRAHEVPSHVAFAGDASNAVIEECVAWNGAEESVGDWMADGKFDEGIEPSFRERYRGWENGVPSLVVREARAKVLEVRARVFVTDWPIGRSVEFETRALPMHPALKEAIVMDEVTNVGFVYRPGGREGLELVEEEWNSEDESVGGGGRRGALTWIGGAVLCLAVVGGIWLNVRGRRVSGE